MPSSNNKSVLRPTKTPGATRFHKLAKREGGITREEALKKAEKFIESLKPQYIEWLRADMEKLQTIVRAFREGVPGPVEWKAAYRQSCVIRDLGSTFDYYTVTDIADSLCELLKRFEGNGVHHQSAVEAHLHALQLVGSTEIKDPAAREGHRLLDGLRQVVDMFPKAGAK